MKYTWFQPLFSLETDKPWCEETSKAIGVKVEKVSKSSYSIEIEFETLPTEAQLNKLDLMFPEYKREGGKSLSERIEELEGKISNIEKIRGIP